MRRRPFRLHQPTTWPLWLLRAAPAPIAGMLSAAAAGLYLMVNPDATETFTELFLMTWGFALVCLAFRIFIIDRDWTRKDKR